MLYLSELGMYKMGKKSYLITENYLIGAGEETFILLSAGGRWEGNKIAIDYGGVFPLNADGFIMIPWLSLTIPFGRN